MTGVVLREAAASARSSLVASVLTVLMVAGMIVAVMLTTGRTVGAEQSVLSSIDDAGTRSIIVRAEDGAGVDTRVLDRLAAIDGIEWAGAFSLAQDVTNASIPGGTRVPIRYAYGADAAALGGAASAPENTALASMKALDQLGMPDGSGVVERTSGQTHVVLGGLDTPDFLRTLEPLLIVPDAPSEPQPVGIVIVIAERPDLVAPLSDSVLSVLGADDPTRVSVSTSEALAQLRDIVQGQLGSFSRGLVLALLGVAGALLAIILFGLVVLRRKDFGRRRALGATRGFIIALLLAQTGLLTVIGVTLGVASATIALLAGGDPLPGPAFVGGLSVLTLLTALVAAVAPGVVASRREPIRELRVP